MRVAATYNIKGGVGKTAAAVNLGFLAARDGFRTLVWDIDPQGAATFYFRVKAKVVGGGKRLLKSEGGLLDHVKSTDYENLDLLPSDWGLRHLDILLDRKKNPAKKLATLLSGLREAYDLVLIDCPPSISLVSEAVFRASDALLVPVIPTPLSVRTLEQLEGFRDREGLDELMLLVFFSMVDRRKRLHHSFMESVRAGREGVLESFIPYASDVERMGEARAPLGAFAGSGKSAKAYEALWSEVRGRLFGR